MQKRRNAEMQKRRNAEMQKRRNAEMQKRRNAEMQKRRNAETQKGGRKVGDGLKVGTLKVEDCEPSNLKPETGIALVRIDVPVASDASGYPQKHVDVQLNQSEAETLRQVLEGVRGQPFRQTKLVQSPADAIRWLLEQIDESRKCGNAETSK